MVAYAFNPGRQDLWEFKANLAYIGNSRTTQPGLHRKILSQKNKKKWGRGESRGLDCVCSCVSVYLYAPMFVFTCLGAADVHVLVWAGVRGGRRPTLDTVLLEINLAF